MMTGSSRRDALKLLAGGALAPAGVPAFAADAGPARAVRGSDAPAHAWATTFEDQRKADLGNGFFLNPIVPGDRPDPTILKDGADYYMTFSSFDTVPGIVIW